MYENKYLTKSKILLRNGITGLGLANSQLAYSQMFN
jgi:hypothetical protein